MEWSSELNAELWRGAQGQRSTERSHSADAELQRGAQVQRSGDFIHTHFSIRTRPREFSASKRVLFTLHIAPSMAVAHIDADRLLQGQSSLGGLLGFGVWQWQESGVPDEIVKQLGEATQYISLSTRSNGACGMHALFGVPSQSHGGSMDCPFPRKLAADLFGDAPSRAAREGGAKHHWLSAVRASLWAELCLPCATQSAAFARQEGSSLAKSHGAVAPSLEARAFWASVSASARSAIVQHVLRMQEDKARSAAAMSQLGQHARACASPELESTVWLPLAKKWMP